MSLNWKEIDAVLSELDLGGAQLQKIIMPAWDTLLLSFYGGGKSSQILICIAHGACRIHETTTIIPKAGKPQRFMELLRAELKGKILLKTSQLAGQRIVKMSFGPEETGPILWARLWSGAANLILTDSDGRIMDALSRKPKRGEMAGGHYFPEEGPLPEKDFQPRDFPGEGSYNRRVDEYYREHGTALSLDALLEKADAYYKKQLGIYEQRRTKLDEKVAKAGDAERFRELGDILMASQHLSPVDGLIHADDFYRGGSVAIRVKKEKSINENARDYYEQGKKARAAASEAGIELELIEKAVKKLEEERNHVLALDNPYLIRAFLQKAAQGQQQAASGWDGIKLEVNGWTILAGRSAKENDELLRKHIKGNDHWLHARDYAGSYVFIKARPGKTVPLDILLDAGMLAIYYSKGRNQGSAELYHTQAKNLKRVKGGPKGLVIPQNEKNLHVKIDSSRLAELKNLIGK